MIDFREDFSFARKSCKRYTLTDQRRTQVLQSDNYKAERAIDVKENLFAAVPPLLSPHDTLDITSGN